MTLVTAHYHAVGGYEQMEQAGCPPQQAFQRREVASVGAHLYGRVTQHFLQALLGDRVALHDVLQQNVQDLCLLPCA